MKRYLLTALGIIVALMLLVVGIGWMLPVEHRATAQAKFRATPAEVFDVIADVEAYPAWRSSVERVEILPEQNGRRRFREIGKDGSILFEVESADEPRRLVTRIADRSLPFGGKWTYDLLPAGDSTTLRITEDGEVYNPVFRFVSRFVMGHSATMKEYLSELKERMTWGKTPGRPDTAR